MLFLYNKNMKIISKPYSDNDLRYNEKNGRYELTIEYVKEICDVPYKNDIVLAQRLKENSRLVYNWIYNHSNTANRQVINFLLHRTENGRSFLIEALESQIIADMGSGYNDIVNTPIINVSTGQEGNRVAFRENAIAISTENIIDDSPGYFDGINIVYQYPYDPMIFRFCLEHSGEI